METTLERVRGESKFIGHRNGGPGRRINSIVACLLLVSCADVFGQACTNAPFTVTCNPNFRHGNGGRAEVSNVCVGEQLPASGEIFFGDANPDAWRVTSATLKINNILQDGGANQEIVGLIGNATCTDSGGTCDPNTGAHCVFPCLIGPSNVTCGDSGLTLPGEAQGGSVIVGASYVIQPADAGTTVEVRFDFSNVDLGTADCSNTPTSVQPVVAFAQILVPDCDDGNECTTDCCQAGICSNTSVCTDTSCDAGNTPKNCDDQNVCTADSCNDANAPTCCAHDPIPCPPLPCMRITGCDPVAGCQYTFDCREPGIDCCPADANPCTTESCSAVTGLCTSTPECTSAADCNDFNICTADSCVGSCCQHENIPCPTIPCQRAIGCDPVSGCIYVPDCRTGPLGQCCPDDGNVCTEETCSQTTGVCGATPDCVTAADCNDGDVCTADSCVNSCCVHQDIPCAEQECKRNTDCDPVLGCLYVSDCRNGPLATCCPDDGNACTHENCNATTGVCGQTVDCTTAANCDDQNLCTVDSCSDSCCIHTPFVCPAIPCKRLVGCNPTSGCQYEDDCRTGPLGTCCPDDPNPCTQATCDATTGLCGTQPNCITDADCNDHDVCTTDTCENSCCVHTSITCPPADLCQRSTGCKSTSGCTYEPLPGPCCGNGIVEAGETCDPPGSPLPGGGTCGPDCGKCGNGFLDEGEECDVGIPCLGQAKPCKDIVCNQCRCVKVNKPNGTVVHWPEVDFCLDFLCQGGIAYDHPKASGTACGNATPEGVCDTPDSCDGFGTCGSNYKDAGTICRPAVDECDVPDRCSGLSGGCPPNACAASGTLATDDGNECTYDICDGQCNRVHPPKPVNTPCGNPQTGICDLPDHCDGHGECDMNLVSTGNPTCRATREAKNAECMRGPNVPYTNPTCFTVDMDQDGDVDLTDCSLSMD